MMPEVDADDVLPLLSPYAVMRLGKVKLLPFYVPSDPKMGVAVCGLAVGGLVGQSRACCRRK